MKFCTNCGTELTAKQKFCRNCGTKTTVEEPLEEQTPEEETLEEQTPEEQTPEEQTPEEQTSEEQTPEEETSEEQTPEEQTPEEESSEEESPEEETPEEQTSEEQTPEEQTPEEESPEEETPEEESPEEESPEEESPEEETLEEQSSEEQTPEEETSEEQTSEEQTPEEETPEEEKKAPNQKIIAAAMGAVAVLGVAISLAFGGSDTSADSMRLETYQGDLTLLNGKTEKEVVEGQRLASEDNLETDTESNAYISLDRAKLLKLDQTSQIEIVESANKLDIEVLKGSLYFNVSQPLEENESLTFYCNNIVTGVRGTSGVITYLDSIDKSEIVLLSGSVEIETNEATQQTETISAGQVAYVTTQVDESVEIVIKNHEDVPGFHFSQGFLDEEEVDISFEEYTGIPWKKGYIDHLRSVDGNYSGSDVISPLLEGFYGSAMISRLEYTLHDMNLDGIPELFLRYPFYDTHDHEEEEKRLYGMLVLGEFGDTFSLHEIPGVQGRIKIGSRSEAETVVSIPHNGNGLYVATANIELVNAGFFSQELEVGSISYSAADQFVEKTEEGFQETNRPNVSNSEWVGGTELMDLTWYHKDDWRPLIDY